MDDNLTLEYVLNKFYPPVEPYGYFSFLPKELRLELARFKSSGYYDVNIKLFDSNILTYKISISSKNLTGLICLQPQHLIFYKNDKPYYGKYAILNFFLYVLELNNTAFDQWPVPIHTLFINNSYYCPFLPKTGKKYLAVPELTPRRDLALEHGIYFNFPISREFIIALYGIAETHTN